MTRLNWYNWEKVGSEKHIRGLPIHAEWSPTEDTIYIRSNDPGIVSHIALGHEIAHWRSPFPGEGLGDELNAWEEAIYNLMRAGEWTPEAKAQVTWALRSYVEEAGVEDIDKETRWWIGRLEDRARKRLRGDK